MTLRMSPLDRPTTLYRLFDQKHQLLYVGIAWNPGERFKQHRHGKPWWSEVASAELAHYPSRALAMDAEVAAIKSEQPRHNVVHNRAADRQWRRHESCALGVSESGSQSDEFSYEHLRSGFQKQGQLWLYPELNCSSCVDDCWSEDGYEQLEHYVDYIEAHQPEWLRVDAVPIYWFVDGRGDNGRGNCFEAAPFCSNTLRLDRQGNHINFLSYFSWPVSVRTGEPLDWFRLPIKMDRFPAFAEALGWQPSPLQPTAPLTSILRSRAGRPPVDHGMFV